MNFLYDIDLKEVSYIYVILFMITLLINAFISGIFKHRLTFRDYLDSFLFPVTYVYIIGLTVSGIFHSIRLRYINTKNQIKVIKEQEALNKLKEHK